MIKKQVSSLVSFWKYLLENPNKDRLQVLLWNFPLSDEILFEYNRVNTIVWWILSHEQKVEIYKYFMWIPWHVESKEVKKLILDVAHFIKNTIINSYSKSSGNLSSNIYEIISKNKWIALEYFILDSLLRNWVNADKWSPNLDHNKIDFLTELDWIFFWNQLTFVDDVDKKWQKSTYLNNLSVEIDSQTHKKSGYYNLSCWSKKYHLNDNNFSIKSLPDIIVFFVINSAFSRELSKSNLLSNAYLEWEISWYNDSWPSIYLENYIQCELDIIWKTYKEWINIFLNFIKNLDNLNRTKQFIVDSNWWFFISKYSPDTKSFELSFYKSLENWKEFIYSLNFYLTNKFLKKVWRSEKFNRTKIFEIPYDKSTTNTGKKFYHRKRKNKN